VPAEFAMTSNTWQTKCYFYTASNMHTGRYGL
jgi:hypothetical protein